MHLEDESRLQALGAQLTVQANECRLEDVGRQSLDAGVHGLALGRLALRSGGGRDIREGTDAAELGARVALRANVLDRLVHVGAQRREAGEVLVHDLLGDAHRDAETTAQSEGLHAVSESVGDGLGLFALLGEHVGRRTAKDRRGDRAVHVFVRGEGREQSGVLGEVRQDAQFDLVVVRDREFPPLARQEGVAQSTSFLGAHRDVVQVRSVRGESPGARHHLVERRVDATVGLDRVDERGTVGSAQLLDLTVAKDERDDLVFVLDRFETRRVGRVARLNLLHRRESHLVEEDRL